ncbi:hypothetical protein [Streptomyces hainanensis]|uniref:Uncharacterized protein n=1 Tax=Streptomyces hainanensis TaxID=402648 RepID=A0A4R4SIF8_9ACTN|nr:hypothetical protein [Streptomyces hainanensis]TDC63271.1 hypothetical protein E1283_32655 [Streptomyces hainanensis]
MTDRLIRLYPAGYRTAHGPEIAATHREMTAGLPRAARLRADADLAAHAVRVRLGLDSASRGGRLFAVAAPFSLAAAAVVAGLELTRWYTGFVVSPTPAWVQLSTTGPGWGLWLLSALLVCVGAVVALTGRWVPGVVAAGCGLLGSVALWGVVEPSRGGGAVVPVAALLTVGVVLACPPDRRADPGLSAAAGAMAGVGWLPLVAVGTGGFVVTTDHGAWPLLVLVASGVALALRRRSSGLLELGAMAVASPSLLGRAYADAWLDLRPVLAMLLALPLAAAATACWQGVRRRRSP